MKSRGYHGRFLAWSNPDLMNTGPPMLYDFDRPAEVFPGPGFQPFIMAVAPQEAEAGSEFLITCGGVFDRGEGSYRSNVVVYADPVT